MAAFGRGVGGSARSTQPVRVGSPGCICLRPTNYVFCQICGAVFKGRSRRGCPQHPNTMYLMDNDMCAYCKRRNTLLEIS